MQELLDNMRSIITRTHFCLCLSLQVILGKAEGIAKRQGWTATLREPNWAACAGVSCLGQTSLCTVCGYQKLRSVVNVTHQRSELSQEGCMPGVKLRQMCPRDAYTGSCRTDGYLVSIMHIIILVSNCAAAPPFSFTEVSFLTERHVHGKRIGGEGREKKGEGRR